LKKEGTGAIGYLEIFFKEMGLTTFFYLLKYS